MNVGTHRNLRLIEGENTNKVIKCQHIIDKLTFKRTNCFGL